MPIRHNIKVRDHRSDITSSVDRAAGRALRAAARKAGRAWQAEMLEQLKQAAVDTEGGGSGRKYRALTRRSRGKREHPARQSGDFAESWQAGAVTIKTVRKGVVEVRAYIESSHERVLEIVAGSSDFFNDWEGPTEARFAFIDAFELEGPLAMRRELRAEGLT